MPNKIVALCWLVGSVAFFTMGEVLSKRFSLSPGWGAGVAVIGVYAVGTALWLPAICAAQSLAVLGTIWTLMGMGSTVLIGVLMFGEPMSASQWVGITFAFIAAGCLLA